MKKLKLLGITVLSFLAIINVYAREASHVEDHVEDKAVEITSENVRELEIDLSTIQPGEIKRKPVASNDDEEEEGNTNNPLHSGEYTPEIGKTYTVTYPNSLNYYGKMLTLQLDLKLVSTYNENDTERLNTNTIVFNNNNKVEIVGHTTSTATGIERYQYPTKFEVTYSFYDENDEPFKYTGLIGFIDPDGGNYLFDTNRDIFYKDAYNSDNTLKFSEAYLLTGEGIVRDFNKTGAFNSAVIYIALTEEESFTMELDIVSDWISIPYLYGLVKDFNINYVLDGGTNHDDNPSTYTTGNEITIQDPTKEGYTFLGWEEGNKIEKWDFGDKTFTARWEKTKYPIATSVQGGTIDDDTEVIVGDNVTINYKPKLGYSLQKVVVDGEEVDLSKYPNSYTFKNVNEPHSIEVIYVINPKTSAFISYGMLGMLGIIGLTAIVVIRKKEQTNKV